MTTEPGLEKGCPPGGTPTLCHRRAWGQRAGGRRHCPILPLRASASLFCFSPSVLPPGQEGQREGGTDRAGAESRCRRVRAEQSRKLPCVLPGSPGAGAKQRRGLWRGLGAARSPFRAVPLLHIKPNLSQAQRGSSDKLVVCVPVGRDPEVTRRAGQKAGLPQNDTAPGSWGATKRTSALALMQ